MGLRPFSRTCMRLFWLHLPMRSLAPPQQTPQALSDLAAKCTSFYEVDRPPLLSVVHTVAEVYENLSHNRSYLEALNVTQFEPLGHSNYTQPPTEALE